MISVISTPHRILLITGLALLLFIGIYRTSGSTSTGVAEPGFVIPDELPVMTIVHGPLSVMRDNETRTLERGDTLLPGDEMETCAGQFAVIDFQSTGYMIVHPVSNVKLDAGENIVRLRNADIHLEQRVNSSGVMPKIACYDAEVSATYHATDTISFGMQCRGESGITISIHRGSLLLQSNSRRYDLAQGMAVSGRATSDTYTEVSQPGRPVFTDFIENESLRMDEEPSSRSFRWRPVSMTDQFLIHIYSPFAERPVHQIRYVNNNEFAVDSLLPGSYHIRVLAVDYYGVTGNWSEPLPFDYLP